jgi:hypothetical protein
VAWRGGVAGLRRGQRERLERKSKRKAREDGKRHPVPAAQEPDKGHGETKEENHQGAADALLRLVMYDNDRPVCGSSSVVVSMIARCHSTWKEE